MKTSLVGIHTPTPLYKTLERPVLSCGVKYGSYEKDMKAESRKVNDLHATNIL